LAGIIIKIREAIASGNAATPDEESDSYKLYTKLTEKGMLVEDGQNTKLKIDRKDLKNLIKDGLLKYEKE